MKPSSHFETINRLFEKQASATPETVAVRCDGRDVSYGELNASANRMAHSLLACGVQPGQFVGVVADHSEKMVAAILAVIKSGATYTAMEPDFPRERIAFILAETGAQIVLTQQKYAAILPDGVTPLWIDDPLAEFPSDNPQPQIDANNALYVLYTSGTTGTPKGVVIEHRNVANYVEAFDAEFVLTRADRMLQCSVCTFDIFVEEFFPVLLRGGTLVIASREQRGDAAALARLMRDERVTLISGFPYLLRDLQEHELPDSLRVAISGGDVLHSEHIAKLAAKIPVYNTYGPSETTVCATYYRYARENGCVPIGKAIRGVSVKILDSGEICIAGAGVGRGYLNRPAETARAFFPDGYRTGDLGRLLPDGNIEFLGRKDRQVMIWGKRVEPSEVEGVMSRMSGVERVAVKLVAPNHLAAYYIASQEISEAQWRDFLERFLTDYMIPKTFILLEAMPHTLSGKIDYGALPHPIVIRRATPDDLELLVELREEVLEAVFGVRAGLQAASRAYYEREDCAIYLAFDGPQVVGCGAICFYRVMPSPDSLDGLCASIMNMYTRPSHRRRGIASRIVEQLVDQARERSVTRITLETTALGEGIYRRFGFARPAEEMELVLV